MASFLAAPNRTCWLCRRESEILRYNHARNTRSFLFRAITLHPAVAEEKATASISAILSQPELTLPCQDEARVKLPVQREASVPHGGRVGSPPLYDPASQTWTFQVHADCWDLVACRVSDPVRFATAWCSALLSSRPEIPQLPLRRSSLRSATRPPSHGKNYRRVSMQRLARFYNRLAAELGLARLPTVHHPIPLSEIGLLHHHHHHQQPPPPAPQLHSTSSITTYPLPGMTETETSKILDSTPTTRGNQTNHEAIAIAQERGSGRGNDNDPFRLLPTEIIHHILTHTRTRDLPSLRLASGYVARLSRPADLPQAFWRSRFELPRGEMGFAMPGPGWAVEEGVVAREVAGEVEGDGNEAGEGERKGEGEKVPPRLRTGREEEFDVLGLKWLDWRGMYFLLRRALVSPSTSQGRGGSCFGGRGGLVQQGHGQYQERTQERGSSLLARLAKRWYWWERLESVVEIYG